MNETIETSDGRQVEVWEHEGKVWLAADVRYVTDSDRAQVFMTPEQAQQLADMLVRAGFASFRSLFKSV